MIENEKIEKAFGFVVLLDALGASAYDLEASKEFIKNSMQFLEILNGKLELFKKIGVYAEPKFFVFGDTILLTINTGKASNLHYLLLAVAEWLRPAILAGLSNKILWRGAVSIGSYLSTDKVAIGPAVADAAFWYDKPQMFGIVATPTCGIYLDHLNEQFIENHKSRIISDEFTLEDSFFKYDVPLKNNMFQTMWTVAWPRVFQCLKNIDKGKGHSPLELYYSLLQDFSIAPSAEAKYINSEKYFKDYLKQHPL